MDTARKHLRQTAIAAREALDMHTRARSDTAIERALDTLLVRLAPRVLGFCWPHRGEADLRVMVGHWLRAHPHRRAALPVVVAPGSPMTFRAWTPDSEMLPDRHGIPTPVEGEILVPDVLLVPLNAFDRAGYRLGYGGGYFDRTLAQIKPTPTTVGVGYEVGRVDTTHPQPHDLPMDWIATEAGIHAGAGPR